MITLKNKNKINVVLNELGQIIGIEDNKLTSVDNDYLYFNKVLMFANMPNLVSVGNNFLFNNYSLVRGDFSKLSRIGDFSLYNNKLLQESTYNVPSYLVKSHLIESLKSLSIKEDNTKKKIKMRLY